MTEPRALTGDFADIKTVKSRSVVQLVVELPIEEGENIVRMFGFPQPGKPVRVAVARIGAAPQIEAKAEPAPVATIPGGKRRWHELTAPQQAAMRCQTEAFWTFLREIGESGVDSADKAAVYVRAICRVRSRAELATDEEARDKWQALDGRYIGWLTGADAA